MATYSRVTHGDWAGNDFHTENQGKNAGFEGTVMLSKKFYFSFSDDGSMSVIVLYPVLKPAFTMHSGQELDMGPNLLFLR
ncbi:MAG: hypothetical protein HKM93_04595 [Desulfobacteraceae bacterium]|nr:hypothetical protein [Desulfobacteraceae bacterium]